MTKGYNLPSLKADSIRSAVYTKVCEIKTYFYTFTSLYGDEETIACMNENATEFFKQHRTLLLDKLILELAKLLDKARDFKNNESIGFPLLIESLSIVDDSIQEELTKTKCALRRLRKIRHKFIAHNDAKVSVTDSKLTIDELVKAVGSVEKLFHLCCGVNHHKVTPDIYPAKSLIRFLKSTTPAESQE